MTNNTSYFYLKIKNSLEQKLNNIFLTRNINVTSELNRKKIVLVNPIINSQGYSLVDETITVTSKDAWLNNVFLIKINMESNGYLEISEIYIDTRTNKKILKFAIKECLNILESFIDPNTEILEESIKQALDQVNK